jgi:hypothetical protein
MGQYENCTTVQIVLYTPTENEDFDIYMPRRTSGGSDTGRLIKPVCERQLILLSMFISMEYSHTECVHRTETGLI